MLQKLDMKNEFGEDLYQEVHLLTRKDGNKKVFGAVGTLKELNKNQVPSVHKKHH